MIFVKQLNPQNYFDLRFASQPPLGRHERQMANKRY